MGRICALLTLLLNRFNLKKLNFQKPIDLDIPSVSISDLLTDQHLTQNQFLEKIIKGITENKKILSSGGLFW